MRAPSLVLVFLAVSLAGCTSTPPTSPPGPLAPDDPNNPFLHPPEVDLTTPLVVSAKQMSARDAVVLALPVARAKAADAVPMGIESAESNASDPSIQLRLRRMGVGLDPSLGDGLIEAWSVRFRATEGVFRVTAYANGTARLEPRVTPPREGEGTAERWQIDSPQAMVVAMADPVFRRVALTPQSIVELTLLPPDALYRNDSAKRVFAEDPYWWFVAQEPSQASASVLVNARTGERILESPEGTIANEKFAHEHATFALFIRGQRVSFDHGAYDIRNISGKVHLHTLDATGALVPGGGSKWHLEGLFNHGQANLTLAQIFAQYGVTFRPSFLALDRLDGHDGSSWPDAGADVWRVFHRNATASPGGPFALAGGDYTAFVPRDGFQVLLTYGHDDDAELARQTAAIPSPR